jgi:hypothetical protein
MAAAKTSRKTIPKKAPKLVKKTAARAPAKKAARAATKPAKKTATKAPAKAGKTAVKAPKRFGTRADLGAPVTVFFAKQPPHLLPTLEAMRKIIEDIAPDATSSIKWGMPFYTVGPGMMCALAGHKSHGRLILPGAPDTYADPDGLLEGDGKTGRHLKLTTLEALPVAAIRGWLRIAAERARGGSSPR